MANAVLASSVWIALVGSSCLATLPPPQPPLSEPRVPACVCGTTPPPGRPGQGLGLPCLDTSRNSTAMVALEGLAWLGPATTGPLCPARGRLQQAAHRLPAQPQLHTLPLFLPRPGAHPGSRHPSPGAGRRSPTWLDQGTGSAEFPELCSQAGSQEVSGAETRLEASHRL